MNTLRICQFLVRKSANISLLHKNYSIILQRQTCKTLAASQIKTVSTVQNVQSKKGDEGLLTKVLKKLPFVQVNKSKMLAAGYMLYENVADQLNYVDFFEELQLPDTFYSWFVITELHIWMLSVRAMAEEEDGRFIRNSMIEALWADVGQRVKKLGAANPAAARAQVTELSEQLQAALIAYDEGLQSDDTVLAGALWRRFYQHSDIDANSLDALVRYVRKHIRYLDNLPTDKLLTRDAIRWTPFLK